MPAAGEISNTWYGSMFVFCRHARKGRERGGGEGEPFGTKTSLTYNYASSFTYDVIFQPGEYWSQSKVYLHHQSRHFDLRYQLGLIQFFLSQTIIHLLKLTARYFDGMKPLRLSIMAQWSKTTLHRHRFYSFQPLTRWKVAWSRVVVRCGKTAAKIGRTSTIKNMIEMWTKTIQRCGIYFQELPNLFFVLLFCAEWVPLEEAIFSGQDEVRASNLIASVMELSAFRSHAPTTQPSCRLKVYESLITQHLFSPS